MKKCDLCGAEAYVKDQRGVYKCCKCEAKACGLTHIFCGELFSTDNPLSYQSYGELDLDPDWEEFSEC